MRFWQAVAFTETEQLVDIARAADELGFAGLTLADHLVTPATIDSPYPYAADAKAYWDPSTDFPDPWVLAAVLAQATTRLRFMTYVYVLPMRDVFTVAKAVSTAAVLSDNRVMLGVGVGWMAEEFELTGQAFRNRGRRTDEMLEVLAKLLTGEMVEHHGEQIDFSPVQLAPAPSKPVPVTVGGHSDAALRRAARADGWLGVNYDPDDVPGVLARLARARADAGTADRPYEVLLALNAPPDVDVYRRLADAGVTAVVNPPWMFHGVPKSSFAYKRETMERFAETYIGPLS